MCVQLRRDPAQQRLDFPGPAAGTQLPAGHANVIGEGLRVVGQDQTQQRGLAAAVGAHQRPVLAAVDGEGHVIQQDDRALPDRDVAKFDQWRTRGRAVVSRCRG